MPLFLVQMYVSKSTISYFFSFEFITCFKLLHRSILNEFSCFDIQCQIAYGDQHYLQNEQHIFPVYLTPSIFTIIYPMQITQH